MNAGRFFVCSLYDEAHSGSSVDGWPERTPYSFVHFRVLRGEYSMSLPTKDTKVHKGNRLVPNLHGQIK